MKLPSSTFYVLAIFLFTTLWIKAQQVLYYSLQHFEIPWTERIPLDVNMAGVILSQVGRLYRSNSQLCLFTESAFFNVGYSEEFIPVLNFAYKCLVFGLLFGY